MQDSTKYLIHADFTANGVVERNDVVGAVFGQTEGLLGDELDLRELQEGSKVGRVDVKVTSEGGQSFGEITIASGLDRVETAILAASLETIERVGPCRATVTVTDLEDVRHAKRREVVERATELLADFEAEAITSHDIVEEVRQRLRVEDITEYEGLPAGPRVAESDAIIVVEGRADVLQLLQFGIKNAVAVEGTDVPEAIADLSRERTVTAFLDGDRGGELILKELAQVGAVDHVAFAPAGTCVEDLSRSQILAALRDKVPYEAVDEGSPAPIAATPDASGDEHDEPRAVTSGGRDVDAEVGTADAASASSETVEPVSPEADSQASPEAAEHSPGEPDDGGGDASDDASPSTIAAHAQAVVTEGTGTVRLLDDEANVLREGPASEAFALVEEADQIPTAVVLDDTLSQRLLDVAAQRGVGEIVARQRGEFVKQPTAVRVRTIEDL
ncbi:DNA primase DnaG [Halomicrobium sp. LC1Hm]|uniref:DNA primase DnaG n=1 Tax=Halomicrobium sp. LC1Hm TaxID=2610902 RepID=UPI00129823DE|nr:DNA primase DnaG [Halomicrobium sp. LC1Hm]QGA81832.1 DNA primase [Halomicrobium sp. LC1Hm]